MIDDFKDDSMMNNTEDHVRFRCSANYIIDWLKSYWLVFIFTLIFFPYGCLSWLKLILIPIRFNRLLCIINIYLHVCSRCLWKFDTNKSCGQLFVFFDKVLKLIFVKQSTIFYQQMMVAMI